MQDSLEDRIHKAGHHEEFSKAVKVFRASRKTNAQQLKLYEQLESWGASSEEADEFVDLLMENDE
jgi:hypothetical protein